MKEPINAIIRNKLICALAEIRFGNIGKAKKHLRSAIFMLNDDLEVQFCNGLDVTPPDGDYKIYIDDLHILTKSIKQGQGTNYFPCLTHVPLLPWRGIVKRYGLITGDFEVISDDKDRATRLVYKDGHVVDKIRQVRGEKNTWVGAYYCNNNLRFWFMMRKV